MGSNSSVPIVNTATRAAIFERQREGNDIGAFKLEPKETYHERRVNLTFETLALRNSSGKFTNHVISSDDLIDFRNERIEVTYDSDHDFQLVKHLLVRRRWFQKFAGWDLFKSRSAGGALPTHNKTTDMDNRM